MSGRSQAVRLPEALRFEGTEVVVKRFGNGVVLLPVQDSYVPMQEAVAEVEPGFCLQREQPAPQTRPELAK